MSLLLDALNKADQERKRNEATPGINSNHDPAFDRNERTVSIVTIIAVIGVLIAALLGGMYWLGKNNQSQPLATATQPQKSQSSTAAINTTTAPVQPVQPITSNAPPSSANNANATADKKSEPEENVANLYQQNADVTAHSVAQQSSSVPTTTTPSSVTQFANLPEITDLPNAVLEKLPSLNYTEHHYNINGGSVVINGSVKHVNDQLANGLVIDKILEDGMVLHFENYIFKMRALNSWVNM